MNFQDVWTCEQVQAVAPPPCLITDQDCEEHRWRQRRLLIEEDKRAMAEWRQRHLEDVANENTFWAERRARRRAERADMRRRKALAISQCNLGNASFFSDNDDMWEDVFLDTSDDTSREEEDDSE